MATEQTPTPDHAHDAQHPAHHGHGGRKIALIVLGSLLGLALLAVLAVFVLTNTEWGHEQIRTRLIAALNTGDRRVHVGRITGNLLQGVTLHDVSITDSSNAPFLKADSVHTGYAIRPFISKKIDLNHVQLWRPVLVLDRPPLGRWNWDRIFPSDTTKKDTTTSTGFGSWIVLRDVHVFDGDVTVRIPWNPDSSLAAASRDSAIKVALDSTSLFRLRVRRVPNGYQQVQYYRRLYGAFPTVRIAAPGEKARLIAADSLRVLASPFRPPEATVTQAHGNIRIDADSLWFRNMQVSMPASYAMISGSYGLNTGGLDIGGDARPASLHDVRFLMPALPDTGVATSRFHVFMGGSDTSVFRFAGMDLRSARTTLQGDLGFSFTPEVRIDTTNVRFAGLTTDMLESLIPAAKSPRKGALSGRLKADGPLADLALDGDVSFDEPRSGRTRIIANGVVGTSDGVVRAQHLAVRLAPFQVALAKIYAPTLPIAGTVTGSATVNGSTATRLDVSGMDLTLADRGQRSRLTGRAAVAMGGSPSAPAPAPSRTTGEGAPPVLASERERVRVRSRSGGSNPWFDLDLNARPLSLVTVGRFAPALGLRGSARGPIRLRGTMRDFAVTSALALNDGGRVSVVGRLGMGDVPTYDMRARLELFNANAVVAKAPSTSITASASVSGRGSDPKTMVARLDADVSTSRIDTVAIDSSRARVRVAGGLLTVDTLAVRAPQTRVDLLGTFGLAAGRSGELSYKVDVDSLAGLARYIPHLTGKVAPRPGILAERVRRAREDSSRFAQRNAVRLAVGESTIPRIPVDTPATIAKDSLAGAVYAAGVLRGNIESFDARGRAGAVKLVALGNTVARARVAYSGNAIRSKQQSFAVAAVADSISAAGFALDSVDVRATYREPGGNVQLAVWQNKGSDVSARADYGLYPDRRELLLGRLVVRFDTTFWAATHPSAVRWGQPGTEVENLELTNGVGGRIFVDGRLPTGGAANMRLQVENFQVADVSGLLQSDVPLKGLADVDAAISGPLTSPIIHATAALDSATYEGTALPDLRATADYADQRITARAEARGSNLAALAAAQGSRVASTTPDTGRVIAVVTGSVPINLALEGVTGPRLADDAPVVADLRADSLPLDVASRFTDAVTEVRGAAHATAQVRGTIKKPTYTGEVALVDAGFRVAAAGILMKDVNGMLHLRGDSVVVDSIAGRTDGRIALSGGIGIKTLSAPSFDLRVTANRATVLDNEIGRIKADAQISAYGPYDGVFLSGGTRVLGGVIYVPESDKKEVISSGDPTVFAVLDTTRLGNKDVVEQQSPLLANLRTDINVAVDRDTWVRSREANVEIYSDGDLRIRMNRAKEQMVLDGIVNTDRGQYTFLSKRFQVKSGSATFIGGTELDPNLQVVAEYEVPSGRPPLTIRILIGGTLSAPRISLESDAQPPIPQSDLLSYLAFGSNTGQLLSLGSGSSVSSSSPNGGLVGTTAALARKQVASMATGVVVDQLESKAGRSLGADVFNITPVPGLPDEFAGGNLGGGLEQFVRGTQVEFGKYFNRQLYVAFQATPVFFEGTPPIPGFVVQYRFANLFGLQLESNWQPRYFLPPPSLTPNQNIEPKNAFGLFLVRNWRF
jgi:autotransporter translocation and assembly factor TamB